MRSMWGANNLEAGRALGLDDIERQMLKDGTFGEDRWALSLLLAKGLVSYRRRYLVFGPRVVRITPQGRKIRKEL